MSDSSPSALSPSALSPSAGAPSARPASLPVVPVRAVLPWLVLAAVWALIALYLVSAEQGATALLSGSAVHEWVHDGRHLLGFPCH